MHTFDAFSCPITVKAPVTVPPDVGKAFPASAYTLCKPAVDAATVRSLAAKELLMQLPVKPTQSREPYSPVLPATVRAFPPTGYVPMPTVDAVKSAN